MADKVRHILSLSGGKDSTALAIYLRDRISDMEYVFCDTQKELKETYDYLDKIEAYLGKPVIRLCDERGFDHWLDVFGGFLPSSQMRWCTKILKIKPFEKYVGEDDVLMYVGIRADENRLAYVSAKPNIKPVYPFKEDGIVRDDVIRILEETIGLPEYYSWRTRSGCYFCFFQRKAEWVGLLEQHPDLYKMAMQYEKPDGEGGGYTWNQAESLAELSLPERVEQIRQRQIANLDSTSNPTKVPLLEVLEDDSDDAPCSFCHI
ncbi:MAG: phosphoadenosine phosphosulfate reductase [Schlesneria sp.]|nr:phosphoadenosine phosphosulfate reductase [Schlesneria sp.]